MGSSWKQMLRLFLTISATRGLLDTGRLIREPQAGIPAG